LPRKLDQRAAASRKRDVTVAKRRESVGAVVALVFRVADAHARRVQQAHDDCDDLVGGQIGQRQVRRHTSTQPRQCCGELRDPVELLLVSCARQAAW
jgi:hypothetical protein